MGLTEDLRAARDEYEGLGFDTLPLRPGTKAAMVERWEARNPYRLWRAAPDGANIGIRAGGDAGLAVLDCDEKKQAGTVDAAVSWLAGLGYMPGDYPMVQTASQIGRHVYMILADTLPGDSRYLAAGFGAGEFRHGPGAYVCAPPSTIDGGGAYVLIGGDLRQLPKVTAADVLPILRVQDTTPEPTRPPIPRRALAMLYGKHVENYQSRSEAEQALITSLVNAGQDFDSVLALFLSHPCAGKFAEMYAKSPKRAITWLKRTYTAAVQWAATHESPARRAAAAALQWAMSSPWPGRTGAVDRAVFTAHAMIAHKAGRLTYAAGARSLAELAEVASPTASAASRRLCDAGLLKLDTPAAGDCAKVYRLQQVDKLYHFQSTLCEEVVKFVHFADVFRVQGLGKAAGEVYRALQAGPASIKELAAATGRGEKTVKRALLRMAGIVDSVTGELMPMVEDNAGQWHALPVDLEQIAEIIGTAGAGARQKERHAKERRAHRRGLEVGKNKLLEVQK